MKRLSRYFAVLSLLVVLLATVSSCSNDGYSLDKFWLSIGTVKDDGKSFVRDEDDKSLWVAANSVNMDYTYERVLLHYTILGDNFGGYDYGIRLNSVPVQILTKNVIYSNPEDEKQQEELGDDPVEIVVIGEGGGYMNIEFKALAGDKEAHSINLVSSKSDLGVEDGIVELELRRNANGDPANYMTKNLVCFRLNKYKIPGRESVIFKVKVKTMNSDYKTYDVVYKYKLDTPPDPESGDGETSVE